MCVCSSECPESVSVCTSTSLYVTAKYCTTTIIHDNLTTIVEATIRNRCLHCSTVVLPSDCMLTNTATVHHYVHCTGGRLHYLYRRK